MSFNCLIEIIGKMLIENYVPILNKIDDWKCVFGDIKECVHFIFFHKLITYWAVKQ